MKKTLNFFLLLFIFTLGGCSTVKKNDIAPPDFYYKLYLDKDTGCQYESVASEIYSRENTKTERTYCGTLPTESVLNKALPPLISFDENDQCYYVRLGWSKGRTPRLDVQGKQMCKKEAGGLDEK